MKKTLFVFAFLIFMHTIAPFGGLGAFAQLSTPPPSPDAEWKQRLGFAYVSVAYERPLLRGREAFGKLVPWGEVWRTGAGDCTNIKFSEDMEFGGQKVKKGKYSLFTIPTPLEWTIILNADTAQHGAFNYDAQKDILRIKAKPEAMANAQESFTIELTDIKQDYTGNLALSWDKTTVKIPLKSYADERIMADIQDKIFTKKTENANLFYNASMYYMNTNRDLKQALAWSQKAEGMDKENFYYVNQSTKILEKLSDYPAAIESAKRAVELGNKKGMKTTAANWQKKIDTWQQQTGTTTATPPAANAHGGHDQMKPFAKQTESKSSGDEVKVSVGLVLKNYYNLKNALIADDAKTANEQASELVKNMAAVPMNKMTAEQNTLFMSLSGKIKTDAQQIANAKDVKQQRERFNDLSNNIFALVKGLKANESAVYQQYCPMKKAYWLSDNAAIKNPYYGKMMLTCGKVTETLN